MNKNYSLITNFGCHWTCPYCIVRENGLNIDETDIFVAKNTIFRLINEDKIDFLSFSGGGDPLFMINEDRVEWYSNILGKCDSSGIFTEMHTSYLNNKLTKNLSFDRIVYHCLKPNQIDMLKKNDNEIVRAVFVVQEYYTKDLILDIMRRVEESDVVTELSFRQRMDDNYEMTYTCHDFLLSGHQDSWWYITQDDYNNYIVNDKISHRYEDFKKQN